MRQIIALAVLALGVFVVGCAPPFGRPGTLMHRAGDEIMVAGQLVHTGVPVVLWFDPGGYDAYRGECRFLDQAKPAKAEGEGTARYGSFRRNVPEDVVKQVRESGWTLPRLQQYVDLFVLHYDVCGTSRRCFQVLQDQRGLSVHFMLDVDGTIYQTLDLKERAWHAGTANDRSVGVEIANIGAYEDTKTLEQWYGHDDRGPYVTFPEWMGATGIRTPNFIARPARAELVEGVIHDRRLKQYDLTDEQYRSLTRLAATLSRVLPRIKPDCPRDAEGRPITRMLTKDELASFSGLVGHYHVDPRKIDPGPALDWERVIARMRREMRRW